MGGWHAAVNCTAVALAQARQDNHHHGSRRHAYPHRTIGRLCFTASDQLACSQIQRAGAFGTAMACNECSDPWTGLSVLRSVTQKTGLPSDGNERLR